MRKNSFTVTDIKCTPKVSRVDTNIDTNIANKVNAFVICKSTPNSVKSNPIVTNKTDKSVIKESKFRRKCLKKRLENGLILLSPNIERKIYKLKKALRGKGFDGQQIKDIVRQRRREEENRFNRSMKKDCLKCRQFGHLLAECPLIVGNSEEGVDVCYRCGSGEHRLSDCVLKSEGLPFAKCFICAQKGHLIRDCPLNKKGVYPRGGSCKECGSVNHLVKDCPNNQQQDMVEEITLPTMQTGDSADAEMMDNSFIRKDKNEVKFIKF